MGTYSCFERFGRLKTNKFKNKNKQAVYTQYGGQLNGEIILRSVVKQTSMKTKKILKSE